MEHPDSGALIASGRRTVRLEAAAVAQLEIGGEFARACGLLLQCGGRVAVMGMGKSGHIARKVAATLASTGTPAFFVHPAEASHGDIGMVVREDLAICISHSGRSRELLDILPVLARIGCPLVAMTGHADSPLARAASVHLHVNVRDEACPLNLAPTSSTTAALVLGDALALALLEARGFSADDFAKSHPKGALGRRLLLRVCDLMQGGDGLPRVARDASLAAALIEMTGKGLGMTTVVDERGRLCGVFTDGDLRRLVDGGGDLGGAVLADAMTAEPRTVAADALAAEALRQMEEHRITALVVCGEGGAPLGVVHLHRLLQEGVM